MAVRKRLAHIAWYHRRVVEEVQETAAMLREDNLLLSTLDGGCKVEVISLLELLSGLRAVRLLPVLP